MAEMENARVLSPGGKRCSEETAKTVKEFVIRRARNSEVSLEDIQHSNAPAELIGLALDHQDAKIRRVAAANPRLTITQIEKALHDVDFEVRKAASLNLNITKKQLCKALQDEHFEVRREAIRNPKADSQHIALALQDIDLNVRKKALKHPRATYDDLCHAIVLDIARRA